MKLISVCPKHDDVDSDWHSSSSSASTTTKPANSPAGKIHEVAFCRVAATVESSYALDEALGASNISEIDESKRWRNGDDGGWIAGG